jgi:hypothetical protein
VIFSIIRSSLARVKGLFERHGDVAVVLGEVDEMPGEFGQGREVVGGQRFALHDREVLSIWFSHDASTGRWINRALGYASRIRLIDVVPAWLEPLSTIQ